VLLSTHTHCMLFIATCSWYDSGAVLGCHSEEVGKVCLSRGCLTGNYESWLMLLLLFHWKVVEAKLQSSSIKFAKANSSQKLIILYGLFTPGFIQLRHFWVSKTSTNWGEISVFGCIIKHVFLCSIVPFWWDYLTIVMFLHYKLRSLGRESLWGKTRSSLDKNLQNGDWLF